MKLIRIALGIRTAHRSPDAEVLAVGTDPAALQAAIDSAPVEFARFELGCFHFQRQGRRTSGVAPSESKSESLPLDEDDGRAMIERIEKLEGILAAERRAMEEERAGLSAEFKRQVEGLLSEIESLRAENQRLTTASVPPKTDGDELPADAPSLLPKGDAKPTGDTDGKKTKPK